MRAQASHNGSGYTRAQLEAVGIGWPPEKGWPERLIGSLISLDQKKRFENTSGRTAYLAEQKRRTEYVERATAQVYYTWPDKTSPIGWRGGEKKPPHWDTIIPPDTSGLLPWEEQ